MKSMCDTRCALGAANDTYDYQSANTKTGYTSGGLDTIVDSDRQGSIPQAFTDHRSVVSVSHLYNAPGFGSAESMLCAVAAKQEVFVCAA